MAGLLQTVMSDAGAAVHVLGELSGDATCLMLAAASADCALRAVAFRAQARALRCRGEARCSAVWGPGIRVCASCGRGGDSRCSPRAHGTACRCARKRRSPLAQRNTPGRLARAAGAALVATAGQPTARVECGRRA
jgi:hypothetical protein